MIGIGSLINVGGILLGGGVGLLTRKIISKKLQKAGLFASGLSLLLLGGCGVISKMLTFEDDHLAVNGSILLITSLSLGFLIGELLKIEARLESIISSLGNKFSKNSETETDPTTSSKHSFSEGLIAACAAVTIGAMAIVGSFTEGLTGDISILVAKALIDFIMILFLTVSYGWSCLLSAIPVFIFQFLLTLLAHFFGPILPEETINHIALVGNVMIFCLGINMTFQKKIPVMNLLPALIIALVWPFGAL